MFISWIEMKQDFQAKNHSPPSLAMTNLLISHIIKIRFDSFHPEEHN